MKTIVGFLLFISAFSPLNGQTSLVVLGTVQDGGAPHIGCTKSCCKNLTATEKAQRMVTSLGLALTPTAYYLFEASPNITNQMQYMQDLGYSDLQGIFLTHAHMGHYAGLLYLGREAWGAKNIPTYVLPKMNTFLLQNGPWSQLVDQNNISLQPMEMNTPQVLSEGLKVIPFQVPHRDEFSETVGYRIEGKAKKALFIPDIDKWEKWNKKLMEEIHKVDYAFIDATFYDAAEINYRPISEIPHPFVVETLTLLEALPIEVRRKVYFIHMNHTNPLLNPNSAASKNVRALGFNIARLGAQFSL